MCLFHTSRIVLVNALITVLAIWFVFVCLFSGLEYAVECVRFMCIVCFQDLSKLLSVCGSCILFIFRTWASCWVCLIPVSCLFVSRTLSMLLSVSDCCNMKILQGILMTPSFLFAGLWAAFPGGGEDHAGGPLHRQHGRHLQDNHPIPPRHTYQESPVRLMMKHSRTSIFLPVPL